MSKRSDQPATAKLQQLTAPTDHQNEHHATTAAFSSITTSAIYPTTSGWTHGAFAQIVRLIRAMEDRVSTKMIQPPCAKTKNDAVQAQRDLCAAKADIALSTLSTQTNDALRIELASEKQAESAPRPHQLELKSQKQTLLPQADPQADPQAITSLQATNEELTKLLKKKDESIALLVDVADKCVRDMTKEISDLQSVIADLREQLAAKSQDTALFEAMHRESTELVTKHATSLLCQRPTATDKSERCRW